ncbi:MAG: serine protease Do [Chthoniobacter sp.]|jgi:S1-C subfamily serine protease|nr:serine protease Do [Chthoniobacter sp.]
MSRFSIIACLVFACCARSFAQSDPASEPAVIAVGKVWPAVVNINTERVIRSTYQDPYDQFFNQFFGRQMAPRRQMAQKVQSLGSGFMVDPAGYIVTNEHVVERAADLKIRVTTSDGKTYDGKYISGDPTRDVAFIKIAADKPFTFISLDDLSPNMLGETVLAVGNPLGYGLSVSRGILSALNRTISLDEVEYKDLLQTDAAINPGNSGGPLIDIGGKLVGVNSVKMSYTPQGVPTQGIGFAIPGRIVRDEVREFMRVLKNPAAAKVSPAQSAARRLFGLQLQDLSSELADALGFEGSKGVLIADVETASPAQQAGLQRGMVIYKIGRFDVNSAREAEALLAKGTSGTPADFLVGVLGRMRGRVVQQTQTVSVTAR